MPHDTPDGPHEAQAQGDGLADTHALLEEAFLDLAEQPLPEGLTSKVRQAILAAQAVQHSTDAPSEQPTKATTPSTTTEATSQAPGSEPQLGEPAAELKPPTPSSATPTPKGWLFWGPIAALACWLALPLLELQPHTQVPSQGRTQPHQVTPPRTTKAPVRRSGNRRFAGTPKSGLVVEMYHARKTPQGFMFRHKTKQGTHLAPGDLVQFAYEDVKSPTHIMILSINRKGNISPYFPLDRTRSIALERKGKLPFGGSLVLDEYLGIERVFVLVSSTEFSLRHAKRALRHAFAKSHGDLQKMRVTKGFRRSTSYLIYKTRPAGRRP